MDTHKEGNLLLSLHSTPRRGICLSYGNTVFGCRGCRVVDIDVDGTGLAKGADLKGPVSSDVQLPHRLGPVLLLGRQSLQ